MIARSLLAGKEVHRAVEALRDTAEYRRITTEQDTEKQSKN